MESMKPMEFFSSCPSWLNPNAEVAAASAVGSTGHWPVPGGDPPLGREQTPELFRTLLGNMSRLPVPSGPWPDGTGGSPVPPNSISEFGLTGPAFGFQLAGSMTGLNDVSGNLLLVVTPRARLFNFRRCKKRP